MNYDVQYISVLSNMFGDENITTYLTSYQT